MIVDVGNTQNDINEYVLMRPTSLAYRSRRNCFFFIFLIKNATNIRLLWSAVRLCFISTDLSSCDDDSKNLIMCYGKMLSRRFLRLDKITHTHTHSIYGGNKVNKRDTLIGLSWLWN